MPVYSDAAVTFLNPIAVLTQMGSFWVVPLLHSVSNNILCAGCGHLCVADVEMSCNTVLPNVYSILHCNICVCLWFVTCPSGFVTVMDPCNVCVYVCVCVCVCMYVCMYVLHTYILVRTYVCVYIRRYIHTYIDTYVHSYVCTYVC